MKHLLFVAGLATAALGGCARHESSLSFDEEKAMVAATPAAGSPDWEKMAWIERVARALRGGRGLNSQDPKLNLTALASKDKGEIIDLLMADPLFGDAVLDFNLYFLGGKPDQLVTDDHKAYNAAAFDYPQAIASAREVLQGGDYLKLLDYLQPVFVGALGQAYSGDMQDMGQPPAKIRQKIFAKVQARTDELIDWVKQNPQAPVSQFCAKFNEDMGGTQQLFAAGIPTNLVAKVILSNDWYGRLQILCVKPDAVEADILADLQSIKEKNTLFFERVSHFEKDDYPMRNVSDVRTMDLGDLVKSVKWTQFGFKQITTLINSSTNYNRKRAAYVLKRFFCDDLTSIAVENPVEHAQDRHGTDPSCLSCHYKLDPMAGFFKDYGIFFSDFSKAKKIFFDDMATMDREAYQASWKAQPGSGRQWNIGYVRSVNDSKLNDYGETLEDLFSIIRKAPETRSCLVRRMFEYFAGTDRMLDPGYLDYLTQGFNASAASSASAAGFKATVKQILLSNSFAQADPQPGQCYDFAPGGVPGSSPPCAVAYILQKNCVKCHSSTVTGKGGLDLAHWLKQEDGHFGFPFIDEIGKQCTRKETFDALLDRLTTSNPERRMPKDSYMSSADREQLYLWALKEGGS